MMNRILDLICAIDLYWTGAVNHLWQATVFAAAIVSLLLLFKRAPAVVRYNLCLIASFKFLFSSSLAVSILRPLGIDLESLFFDLIWTFRDPKWVFLHQQQQLFPVAEMKSSLWPFLGFAVWASGAIWIFMNWMLKQRKFSRTLLSARQLPELQSRINELSEFIRLKHPPRLLVSAEFIEAGVWGIRRPAIVLPEEMLQQRSEEEIDAVLLHELTHIARHDNLVAHMNMVICAIFWFHPLVWWLNRRMLIEREMICDARVVERTGSTREYRNGLLKVLSFNTGLSIAGVSCARGGNLQKRISALLSNRGKYRTRIDSLTTLLPVLAVLILFVFFTVAAIPVLPCYGGLWFQLTYLQP